MDILNLNYAEFERFLFVLFRVGAMIIFVPILGSRQIPAVLKIGLILFLSMAIFPLVQDRPMPEPKGLFELSKLEILRYSQLFNFKSTSINKIYPMEMEHLS